MFKSRGISLKHIALRVRSVFMKYDTKDLHKLNILKLREIGKSLHIKGVTNKSKEDLVEALANYGEKKSGKKNGDVNLELLRQLSTQEAKDNLMKGTYKGFVLVEGEEILCKMYDEEFFPLNISVPITTVKSSNIVDGDFIEAKVSIYDGIRFVSTVLEVNNNKNFKPNVDIAHTRELCLVPNVIEFVTQRHRQDSQDRTMLFVTPLVLEDEIHRLQKMDIESMANEIFNYDENGYYLARLAMGKLKRLAQSGGKVIAYCDLDRTFMSLLMKMDNASAIMKLRKIFAASCEFESGGSLQIVGITISKNLFDELKSFATKQTILE